MKPRLYIFGAGGFGREVAWLAERTGNYSDIRFLVSDDKFRVGPVNGIAVETTAEASCSSGDCFVVAIGDPQAKALAAERCAKLGLVPAVLIHPTVELSDTVSIAPGAIICAGTTLTTNITIGSHAHVNLHCTVGHDATIGDFATLSPGVHISGNVAVGEKVFVGTGAVVINGTNQSPLQILEGAVVGAGACVTRNVEAGALVAGVPAVRKR